MKKFSALFSIFFALGLVVSWGIMIGETTTQAAPTENVITVMTTEDRMDAFDETCSLREALYNTNNPNLDPWSPVVGECPPASETELNVIQIQSGETYTLTLTGNDDNGGDLDVRRDVRWDVVGGESPAILLMQVSNERAIEVHPDTTLTLANLTVQADDNNNGGIDNKGTLNLTDVTLTENTAASGGALYNSGTAVVVDSTFLSNKANDLFGGGAIVNLGTLTLQNTLVRANESSSRGGGIVNDGTLTISDKSIIGSNNSGNDGGGIYNATDGILTLTDSTVDANTAANNGGGLYLEGGTFTTENSTFSGNTADQNGGAIFADQDGQPSVTIHSANFSFNKASNMRGGGIYYSNVFGNTDLTHLLNVRDSLFQSNEAGGSGGAINASLYVTNSQFISNTSGQFGGAITAIYVYGDTLEVRGNTAQENGGGIYTWRISRQSPAVPMQNLTLIGNKALNGSGGGLASFRVNLENAVVSGNQAGTTAGGIHIRQQTTLPSTLSHVAIFNNSAGTNGGGLSVFNDLIMSNTTISSNGSQENGSGLYIASNGVVTATNVTIADNMLSVDVYKLGQLTLQNSIISNPEQINCIGSVDFPLINSLGNNLADDGDGNNCWNPTETDIINPDTLLLPLADNGGGTMTHALQAGSPAIGAGNAAACAAAPVNGVDQRGMPRPADSCDIGAFQTQPILIFLPVIMR